MRIITGSDLKRLRVLAGKTTKEIANAVGRKSDKTIHHWEAEQSSPSMNELILLAQYCGFNPHEIISFCLKRQSSEERVPEHLYQHSKSFVSRRSPVQSDYKSSQYQAIGIPQ